MTRLSSYRDFDWVLLGFVLLLSLISVLEIKSATLHTKFHGFDHKQISFLAIGLVLMFLISLIDYHRLIDIVHWAYGIGILSLIAVALFGTKVLGGKRWISFHGVHFQPSEWIKLVLIVAVARYFWGLAGRELSWAEIGKVSALVFVPMLFVLKQPDLGTALTYLPILICGLFLGGIRFKQVAIVLLALVFVGGIAWKSGKHLKPYQQARINAFINPDSDPRGSGYQIRQSLIAVGSGGIWARAPTRAPRLKATSSPSPTQTSSSPPSVKNTASSAPSASFCCTSSSSCASFRMPRPPLTCPVASSLWESSRSSSSRSPSTSAWSLASCRLRDTSASAQLRRLLGSLYLHGPWHSHEHPHAPLRQLRTVLRKRENRHHAEDFFCCRFRTLV